ncbi:sugar transferase [Flavobacterium sp. Sd200]|uniref:sugar transferase n=1 Tax=Flavobacterium sp. Sd200 TaxID=2692211 RepID=UPI00136B8867|nr:sugar transferase [Flavobacterium sp. Sd200]MXN91982.1 sugar transferase [Flavobacterium sp. Sd200]
MAKRIFDVLFALLCLVFFSSIILVFFIAATLSTGQNGMFTQVRVGQYGKIFTIYKIRSIKNIQPDIKVITPLGRFMRKYKVDELPQLFNIIVGDMSFVGPRPDLSGYYDKLEGPERELLKLKPGLTGPASLKYANEEEILANVPDPLWYNDTVIFPDKVRINMEYLKKRSLLYDFKIILCTIVGSKQNLNYF